MDANRNRSRWAVVAFLALGVFTLAREANARDVIIETGDLLPTPSGSAPYEFHSAPAATTDGLWLQGLTNTSTRGAWAWDRSSRFLSPKFSGEAPVPGLTGWRWIRILGAQLASGDGGYLVVAEVQRGTEQTADARSVGIWTVHGDGALRLRIRSSDPAPGISGARIREFVQWALNRRGDFAVLARLDTGPGGVTDKNDLVVLGPDGAGGLRPLIREGDVLEGGTVNEEFLTLEVADSTVVVTVDIGIPRVLLRFDSRGRREILAKGGDAVDAASGARTLRYYDVQFGLDVNRHGDAFFVGETRLPNGTDPQLSFLHADGARIRAIAVAGGPLAPEQGGPGRYFGRPVGPSASNAQGEVAFTLLTRGSNDERGGLWWSGGVDTLVRVAEEKQQVVVTNPALIPPGEPDNPFPWEYRAVGGFALSDSGILAFDAVIGQPFGPSAECIFSRDAAGAVSILECDTTTTVGIGVPRQNYPSTPLMEDGRVLALERSGYADYAVVLVPEATNGALAGVCALIALLVRAKRAE